MVRLLSPFVDIVQARGNRIVALFAFIDEIPK